MIVPGSTDTDLACLIDWNDPIELDWDFAQEIGVVGYYPMWPSGGVYIQNLANPGVYTLDSTSGGGSAFSPASDWGFYGTDGAPAFKVNTTRRGFIAPVAFSGWPFWINGWLYPDGIPATNHAYSSLHTSNSSYDNSIYFLGNGGSLTWQVYPTGANNATSSGTLVAKQWQCITGLSRDSNDHNCYINGRAKGTNTNTLTISPTNPTFDIGGYSYSGNISTHWQENFDGRLADFAFGNKAMSDGMVAELASRPFRLAWQPSSRLIFDMTAAGGGGGGTVIPVFMHHYMQQGQA